MDLKTAAPRTRREFLLAAAKSLASAGVAAAAYGGLDERTHVTVRQVVVALERLPEAFDGLTIAQLSDFHYHPYFSAGVIRKAVALTAELKPDLVALTGDFVTVSEFHKYDPKAAEEAAPCAELLAPLKPTLGTFAVLGNHDSHTNPGLVTEALSARGIRVLHNASVPLERSGARLWIAGVGDVLTGFADLKATLASVPAGEPSLLLAHEPDFADHSSRFQVDLQLSGHSHGGQVCLPLIGPPFLPTMGRKYPRGLRRVRQTALYTNVGLGTIVAPIRILAQPEVTLLTLRRGST